MLGRAEKARRIRININELRFCGNILAHITHINGDTTPRFQAPVIVKFARFPWEIDCYDQGTQAYSWVEGHDIGPAFLGHVTEGERVIGFLLQKWMDGMLDIPVCSSVALWYQIYTASASTTEI